MSRIIAFPSARPADREGVDIVKLAAQLQQVERTDSTNETLLDLAADLEATLLEALADTPAQTLPEAAVKLATLLRRVEASDGFFSNSDVSLLRGTLRDLCHLNQAKVAAQA